MKNNSEVNEPISELLAVFPLTYLLLLSFRSVVSDFLLKHALLEL